MLKPGPINAAATHVATNVRVLRRRQALSLGQLAARAGTSKGTLSKLETGDANPTLETLATLAAALSVPLADLFAAPAFGIEVVRAGEGIDLGAGGSAARLMHVLSRDRMLVEVYDLLLPPGMSEVSTTHGEGSWEHVLVRAGRVLAGPVDESAELAEGDYAVYPADRPHRWECAGPEEARVWIVLTVAHQEAAS